MAGGGILVPDNNIKSYNGRLTWYALLAFQLPRMASQFCNRQGLVQQFARKRMWRSKRLISRRSCAVLQGCGPDLHRGINWRASLRVS